jgi:hypothetical protein
MPVGSVVLARETKQESTSFLKKRSKKLSLTWSGVVEAPADQVNKKFFSKKKGLLANLRR